MSDDEDTSKLLNSNVNYDNNPDLLNTNFKNINHSQKSSGNLNTSKQQIHNCIFFNLSKKQLLLVSTSTVLTGLLFGYEIGLGANYLKIIGTDFELDCTEQNVIVTAWIVGAILASVFGGCTVDKLGRRASVFSSTLLICCSAILAALSNSFILLLCSRIIAGFGGSLIIIAKLIYNVECLRAESRGKGACLLPLGVASGLLVASLMSQSDINWRIVMGLSAALSGLIFLIMLLFLPPSPNFTLFLMTKQTTNKPKQWPLSSFLLQSLVLCIILAIFHQLTGHNVVRFYAPRVMGLLGICASSQQKAAIITLSIVKLLSTGLLIYTIDKLGRRSSIIIGSSIMMLSLILLAIMSNIDEESKISPNIQPHRNLNYEHTTINMNPYENLIAKIEEKFKLQQENCKRVLIGNSIGFLSMTNENSNGLASKREEITRNDVKTPYPFLPTPLALSSTYNEDTSLLQCADDDQGISSSMSTWLRVFAIILLLLYEAANTLASSFVFWIVVCEILPCFLRGRILGIAVGINWIFDLILQGSFSALINFLTLPGAFFMHSIMCALILVIVYLFLPETRSKTLHEIALDMKTTSYYERMLENFKQLGNIRNNYRHRPVKSTLI